MANKPISQTALNREVEWAIVRERNVIADWLRNEAEKLDKQPFNVCGVGLVSPDRANMAVVLRHIAFSISAGLIPTPKEQPHE